MVVDQSGKGNNGYLHGAPTIGTDDKGNGTMTAANSSGTMTTQT